MTVGQGMPLLKIARANEAVTEVAVEAVVETAEPGMTCYNCRRRPHVA
jgi:hypothetical protein